MLGFRGAWNFGPGNSECLFGHHLEWGERLGVVRGLSATFNILQPLKDARTSNKQLGNQSRRSLGEGISSNAK